MVNLETSEVVLSYGSKRIVDDLDFVVPEGKITAIIGPQGPGKADLSSGASQSPSTSGRNGPAQWTRHP